MSGKFALIIGNTEYSDSGLAQLTAPGKDTEDFARILKDQAIGAFDEVNILLNQPSYIVNEAIDEFFDQKKPNDLLVLYFSGHGVRDEMGALYLAVKNTSRLRLRATAIKSDYIRESMDQSRSKRQVLILDCCMSGAFSQGTKTATGVSIGTASAFESGYGRIILTASDSIQFAWEGDKVIGKTDNSLFTHYLVEGLKGEADIDGDGRITVDELYDYAYEKVRFATPKQTPSKFSSKQQGEIILRQNMRIEDIKSMPLPDDLLREADDIRPYVREAAVRELEKILKGKNIGMARSAVEILEKIVADENTTRRVAEAATQALDSFHQIEQKAAEERRAREEEERLAMLKAEEERLARETAQAEKKAKEEAERLAHAQAERVAAESKAAQLKAEREATEKAAREAIEKAAKEKVEKEAAEREAAQLEAEREIAREKAEKIAALKAEREAVKIASRKKAERKTAEKAEQEAVELAVRRKAEREATEKTERPRWSILISSIMVFLGVCVIVAGAKAILSYLDSLDDSPPATETPIETETPRITKVPRTELQSISAINVNDITILDNFAFTNFIESISFSPDSSTLAVGGSDGIWLYDLVQGREIDFPTTQIDSVHTVSFNSEGTIIFSGSADPQGGQMRAWDWKKGKELWNILVADPGWGVNVSSDLNDKWLVTSVAYENIILWSMGNPPQQDKIIPYYGGSTSFSPQGNWIGFWEENGGVRLYNIMTEEEKLLPASGAPGYFPKVTFSPNGDLVAAGDRDGVLHIWLIEDGSVLHTISAHKEWMHSIAFSASGDILATGANDNLIKIWRVSDGSLLKTLEGHSGNINSIAFSPNGSFLASGAQDGTLMVWVVVK